MGKRKEVLSEGHKEKLRNQIITGARNYKKFLMNKVFLIICEDGSENEVRFFKNDFMHMTGLYSNLDEETFFEYCTKAKIDKGNIESFQKYDWSTLKKKGNKIEKIHELLYKDDQKTLLLEALDTNTYVFPIAVKDNENDICIGFVSDVNRARSLRSSRNSVKAKAEKKIIAIFARNNAESMYSELVYVSKVLGVYTKNEGLLEKIGEPILERFLEIITRPENN